MRSRVKTVPMIMQMEAVECGAASLTMILAYFGKWVPLEQVRADCGVSRDGASSANILKAARGYGLTAKGKAMGLSALKQQKPFPCIIHWNFNHFVVLTGIRGRSAYLNDPSHGRIRVPLSTFSESYTGIAMVFEPTETFERGGRKPSPWRFAFERIRSMSSGIALVLLATLLSTFAAICFTTSGRAFLDYILPRKDASAFGIPALILLALTLVYFQTRCLHILCMIRLQGRSAVVESSRFMRHLLRLPMNFYEQRTVGDLQMRQRENETVNMTLMTKVAPVIVNLVMLVLYLVIMISYSAELALIGAGTALINALAGGFISKKRIDITRSMTSDSGRLYAATVGGVDMIETLKSAGAENGFFRRWAGFQASVAASKVKLSRINETLGLIPAFLAEIANLAVFGLGVLLIIRNEFTPGMLLSFTGLLGAFMSPVDELIALGQTIQEMQVEMERVEDVLHYPAEESPDVQITREEWDSIQKLKGNIEMNHLTFGYSRLAKPLLADFSLTIRAGEQIAFVGASGSGKSTVGKLISGLYQPWEGEILFDGKPAREIPRAQMKGSLGVVDQDIMMFDDSIRQNIQLWDDSIEDYDVVLACRDACIHEEISARKEGYSAAVEPGGRNFSGGQLQRMEIARVLALDPTILILDEATSALDAETEEEVLRRIRARGITCIIVAHRLSTIRDCDRIYVLQDGKIAEQGNHEELIRLDGLYKRLVTSEQ